MSQPPVQGVPPSFQPPPSGGGYGGDLQSFGQPPPPPPPAAPPPLAAPPWTPQGYPSFGSPSPSGYPLAQSGSGWRSPSSTEAPQRPAVVAMAATMAVTASLQWICALSFVWLTAAVGIQDLATSGFDGGLYHIMNRFHDRMLEGLAWPLYLFPTASFVLGFVLLARRQWARIAFTVTGAAAIGWSAWLLRNDLIWWLSPAAYVAVAVLIVWSPAANRWYGLRADRPGPLAA